MTATTTEFYKDTNWQGSIGPEVHRNFKREDLWPHANNGPAAKDALAAGLHPVLAIGPITEADGRPTNPVGVLVDFLADPLTAANGRAVMNVAPGVVVKQYVANVLTYSTTPATFETSLTFMYPVYVDDSDDLAAGVTLSLSPLNDAGLDNPLAGWLYRSQTQDPSTGWGGDNADVYPTTVANELVYTLCDVMLVGVGGGQRVAGS